MAIAQANSCVPAVSVLGGANCCQTTALHKIATEIPSKTDILNQALYDLSFP